MLKNSIVFSISARLKGVWSNPRPTVEDDQTYKTASVSHTMFGLIYLREPWIYSKATQRYRILQSKGMC